MERFWCSPVSIRDGLNVDWVVSVGHGTRLSGYPPVRLHRYGTSPARCASWDVRRRDHWSDLIFIPLIGRRALLSSGSGSADPSCGCAYGFAARLSGA